jgi:hypothetical protein
VALTLLAAALHRRTPLPITPVVVLPELVLAEELLKRVVERILLVREAVPQPPHAGALLPRGVAVVFLELRPHRLAGRQEAVALRPGAGHEPVKESGIPSALGVIERSDARERVRGGRALQDYGIRRGHIAPRTAVLASTQRRRSSTSSLRMFCPTTSTSSLDSYPGAETLTYWVRQLSTSDRSKRNRYSP